MLLLLMGGNLQARDRQRDRERSMRNFSDDEGHLDPCHLDKERQRMTTGACVLCALNILAC